MILVFDVGNTETTIGLFDGEALRGHWRVMTDVARTPDEIALLIRALIASDDVDRASIDRAAIGSVVP
ncbi:MAG TPA: type III pantothenate kinase, partial [Gemmatimonadaceae bacterium]|nr:type III pantothenate kinase [Gemmatimonadaceae bacterium]